MTDANDTPSTNGADAGRRLGGTTAVRALCGFALLLFAAFVAARHLHWADSLHTDLSHTTVPGVHAARVPQPVDGTIWSGLTLPIALCGIALVWANALYLIWPRVIDALVPAIANLAVGAALAVSVLYFIVYTDPVLGGGTFGGVRLEYSATAGATVALLIALLIAVTGAAQVLMRPRNP